jgi:hypothetical protein
LHSRSRLAPEAPSRPFQAPEVGIGTIPQGRFSPGAVASPLSNADQATLIDLLTRLIERDSG